MSAADAAAVADFTAFWASMIGIPLALGAVAILADYVIRGAMRVYDRRAWRTL